MDPTQFQVADISQTSVCPLARVMRQECKKRKIKNVKVVFSTEKVLHPIEVIPAEESSADSKSTVRRDIPGSTAFVPSVAGLIIASEIIKDLTEEATAMARSL